ncbi:uncharacterized protein LOC112573332 isoform X3 [Pomacea canaliculata]|uniref:uncharacterized protein LOC112573332 isoform X3 n=1 Tax=Pomacea canaliculata TaxID=400727 RepID=UPI000D72DF9A|nr:uncharacterized protein LOC112573332 isoform X3 [Pomacea canaliculata]
MSVDLGQCNQPEMNTESSDTIQDHEDEDKDTEEEKKEIIQKSAESDNDTSSVNLSTDTKLEEDTEKDEKDRVKDESTPDHSQTNGDKDSDIPVTSVADADSGVKKTITPPTTTTSHLYTVLMAPLDGRSPLYKKWTTHSSCNEDSDDVPKKKVRLDAPSSGEASNRPDDGAVADTLGTKQGINSLSSVGMDLSKNQKRKLKKRRRKHLLGKLEIQRAKEFIYSGENEQYSIEKLRTMIEDVTEFLDAIWDVYCSEARLKGESVEEEGYRAAAVLKCLSASGEGSWTDLQLLSRAKSVLVLRSKTMAASTIARVENELGYDPDIRAFIVRMLRFWMDEIVTKG